MSNGDGGLEFLRFGSSIPGSYWGCCAADIIQYFNADPDGKNSIQLVSGDGGGALTGANGPLFAGPTNKDIFLQRLRIGTFSTNDMPNHAFFVIMNASQVASPNGKKWLAILKENGFEFLRTVNNSVWNVVNYIFVLIRNVGPNAIANQFDPPQAWKDLPDNVPEAWQQISDGKALTKAIAAKQRVSYDLLPKNKFLTEEEVRAAGAPVILAGLRSEYHRPQKKEDREAKAVEQGIKKATPLFPASPAGGPASAM